MDDDTRERFDRLDARLDDHGARLAHLDGRLDRLDRRIDDMHAEARIDYAATRETLHSIERGLFRLAETLSELAVLTVRHLGDGHTHGEAA